MTGTMAKLSAITTVVLIALAALILYVTSNPGLRGTSFEAEFEDAFPILAGMNVRVNGAVAGSVHEVEVSDEGTAVVTGVLNEGTGEPRSDATASIRQQDVTGDSYLSLSLGEGAEPLGDETIPVDRSLVSPRFDDLLNSFAEPERAALRLILVEVGKALERNGEDLNAAALNLRPALQATDEALGELATQNQALGQLVADAEQVTGQTAQRSTELAGLIDSLAVTLSTTAAHGEALDAGIANLPPTAIQARETLTRLRRTAVAAKPLALELARGAPQLARSLKLAGPFFGDARRALGSVGPTLTNATALLRDSRPTLQASPKRVLTAPFDVAQNVDDLLRVLLGNESVLKTLFGADAYGEGPSRLDDVGLGAFAVEKGNQSGYGAHDPDRRFLRAKTIVSCEAFGFPVEPGCLIDAINTMSAAARRDANEDTGGTEALELPASPRDLPPLQPPDSGGDPAPLLPGAGPPPLVPGGPAGGEPSSGIPLLDFLLRP